MSKTKGGRTYRPHQSQKGAPMWRDPSHVQPGPGCGGLLVFVLSALVATGSGVVTYFM